MVQVPDGVPSYDKAMFQVVLTIHSCMVERLRFSRKDVCDDCSMVSCDAVIHRLRRSRDNCGNRRSSNMPSFLNRESRQGELVCHLIFSEGLL